jgi:2'-5' RNA ligase
MACAVSLLFNAEVADAVSERWQRLADAGLSRSMLELGYPPHVTLAVFDDLDARAIVAALDGVFNRASHIEVSLVGIVTFGPGSGVCYAALAPLPELHRLHETVLAAIDKTCRPHYQAGRWTPHCTLATNLPDAELERARKLLVRDWRPVSAPSTLPTSWNSRQLSESGAGLFQLPDPTARPELVSSAAPARWREPARTSACAGHSPP